LDAAIPSPEPPEGRVGAQLKPYAGRH
jgi:hypothetical protein